MDTTEKPYYLQQLEHTFEGRVKVNPRYSLRAFARDIQFSPQRLSMVMNAKFGLSRASASQICAALAYDPKTTSLFMDSVDSHHHRSPKVREAARTRLANKRRIFNSLDLDRFSVIADWHHFAVIELTRTEAVTSKDFKKIATSLGISLIEAKNAITRLFALDLITVKPDGFLKPSGSFIAGANNHSKSVAIQRHNTQLIEKALTSVVTQSPQERELRTLGSGLVYM